MPILVSFSLGCIKFFSDTNCSDTGKIRDLIINININPTITTSELTAKRKGQV